jgi:hypothetical protein
VSFLLPNAALEQHIIALGKTGAGKSSAIRDLVEHLLDKDERVIVVTPKADWWGLKLSADGKSAGYPVVVFGGEHQDMPLHHLSGKTMAELLGTGNRSAVLQMRDFMPGERTQFWIDFASTLFRILRGKLYLVIDEVHNFAPKGKVLDNKAGMMLHWSNKLASEARGLGITLIGASQRAAKVHNDFLTSCETLIAMRVTTKWDRDAVKDWIAGCGDSDRGVEVLNSLAGMKRGDAWVWSPEAEFGPKQLHFPMFKTYDSFRPQKAHEAAKLKGWAEVNLDEVKKKLEAVVKQAEANDPAKLKARIAELERQVKKPTTAAPVANEEIKKIREQVVALQKYVNQQDRYISDQKRDIDRLIGELQKIQIRPIISAPNIPLVPITPKENPYSQSAQLRRKIDPMNAPPRPPRLEYDGDVSSSQMRILRSLAELDAIGQSPAAKETVAFWSEQRSTSGGYFNNLGKLRSSGLIDYPSPGKVCLTDAGRSKVGSVTPPDSDEVIRRVESLLSGSQRRILEVLRQTHPDPISKDELAERSEQKATSGGYFNNLGAMRTAGLLDYPSPGMVLASEWLFAA